MSEYKGLHADVWRSLTAADSQLPHALLFAGPRGVGKLEMARALAMRLLCESAQQAHATACGHCTSCKLLASESHPDFRVIQPEGSEAEEGASAEAEKKKGSQQIRIKQLRDLLDFFQIGAHRSGARVCIIEPAEAMNAVTSNSLLKLLEEPSPSLYFIIISYRWNLLLPTLISRMRRVHFSAPGEEESQAWLKHQACENAADWLPFFGRAPFDLLNAVQSGRLNVLQSLLADLLNPRAPLAHANHWESCLKSEPGITMEELVVTLQKWLFDIGQLASGAQPRYFTHEISKLQNICKNISLPLLLRTQSQLAQIRRLANHPLNAKLFVEDLSFRVMLPLGTSK